MRLDRLTLKAQDAVQAAQGVAEEFKQSSIDPEHLLLALIRQEDGITKPLLDKVGAFTGSIAADLAAELERQPKVEGASAYGSAIGQRLKESLDEAFRAAEKMDDDYVSTEHLLIGLAADTKGFAGRTLRAAGADRASLERAIADIRGGRRVTDQSPEEKYQALEKYGRDLTAEARAGRLDPVIGRDEEIRRVVQVLSRRTKNNPVLIGEPGVGKTAIAEGLAQRVVAGD